LSSGDIQVKRDNFGLFSEPPHTCDILFLENTVICVIFLLPIFLNGKNT
jgi:hypothetical protein